MGNCMKTPRTRELEEEEIEQQQQEEIEKGNGVEKGSIKVKIVLTKQELELFLQKLQNNNGGKSLEDLVAEVEKARSGKVDSWRPSLDSIMEEDDLEGLEPDRS